MRSRRSIFRDMESESWSVTKTLNGSHLFVVEGYTLLKGIGVGKHVKSEKFDAGGHRWIIYLYPDGKYPEDNTVFISVYLALVSLATNVRAIFEFTLLDQSDKGEHMVNDYFTTNLIDGPQIFHFGSFWGIRHFIAKDKLEKSTFLKDDCLKINCVVGVPVTSVEVPKPLVNIPKSDIGSYFGKLLENEKGSDVTFLVGGERFRAHKLVLTTRSTAFKTMFLTGKQEEGPNSDKCIVVDGMEPKVFKALIHFIYTDTLEEDEELLMSCSEFLPSLSESFPGKLLVAAQKYGFPRLELMCQSAIAKEISIDSVGYIMDFADRNQAEELKSLCLKFSTNNVVGES
ncbi:BTB/POZ and MATH domain-containing protein 4 [Cajanus cajan]|uniref:BTB/POZ and MATH domain-containing protein 4 n=1 Tax=Cajanus cajan TaxID=3821 RepID=UPI0010FB99C2|nr:BTB/POZ and MATH domain-containing protein 4 [Cajanus cajan]